MPRIALLTDTMRGGGAERVMAILANELARRGIPVDLLLIRAEGEYLSQLSPTVRIVPLGSTRIATSVWPLARYLRRERPQCLLSTLTAVNLAAVAAHRIARSPARLLVRQATTLSASVPGAPKRQDKALPWLVRRGYPMADCIIAVSRGVARDLETSLGLPGERIEVIYNPIIDGELPRLAAQDASHPWLSDPAEPLVLAVGRLTRAKNYELLLRAFALLRKELPARLLILGEGEERESLTRLAQQLAVEPWVAMPGFVANPFAYMSKASALAMSSAWEGLPGVLIQALACGCPVVSTDCPHGPREVLDSGRIGRLVPVEDPAALCAGLAAAIRGELRAAEPEWLAQFSTATVVRRYLQVMGVEAA